MLAFASCFACSQEKVQTYRLPPGSGEVYYDPERGILRKGQNYDSSEEELYRQALLAFQNSDYSQAIKLAASLRSHPEYVDGPRALDAIMLEAYALFEQAKTPDTSWLLQDLGYAYFDNDLVALQRLPHNLFKDNIQHFQQQMRSRIQEVDAIEASWEHSKKILSHFQTALGVAPDLRFALEKHIRNLAWIAFLTQDYILAEKIARELNHRNPNQSVSAQVHFILAQTTDAIGWYERSELAYAQAYKTSEEPALREQALLGEIKAILKQSKGWEYDITPYRKVQQKLSEYRQDFLVRYQKAQLQQEFQTIEDEVHEILQRRNAAAAEAYDKLFAPEASNVYKKYAEADQNKKE